MPVNPPPLNDTSMSRCSLYFTGFSPFTQSSNSSSASLLLASEKASCVTRLILAKALSRSCWCESVKDTGGLSRLTGLRRTPVRMRANMLASGSTAGTHKTHIQQRSQNKYFTGHEIILICFWKLKWIMKMCLPIKITNKDAQQFPKHTSLSLLSTASHRR